MPLQGHVLGQGCAPKRCWRSPQHRGSLCLVHLLPTTLDSPLPEQVPSCNQSSTAPGVPSLPQPWVTDAHLPAALYPKGPPDTGSQAEPDLPAGTQGHMGQPLYTLLAMAWNTYLSLNRLSHTDFIKCHVIFCAGAKRFCLSYSIGHSRVQLAACASQVTLDSICRHLWLSQLRAKLLASAGC